MTEQQTYTFNARLVHGLILAIFASLISIAGYMILWAQNDASFKADLIRRLQVQERDVAIIQMQISQGVLPLARQRLETVEREVRELQADLRKHGMKD
jgi:hypothetical protein